MIEILEALSVDYLEAKARGLVELYERLTEPKPTFITFRKNIEMLESSGCINLAISSEKKSKRMITITAKFYKELEQQTSTIGEFWRDMYIVSVDRFASIKNEILTNQKCRHWVQAMQSNAETMSTGHKLRSPSQSKLLQN